MSKGFIENSDTFRVTYPDTEWIDIKTELTQSDNDYILSKMAGGRIGKAMEVDLDLGRLPLMERAIVAWSFTDAESKPVPLTSSNISQLRTKYRILVLKEIDRLNTEAQGFSKN